MLLTLIGLGRLCVSFLLLILLFGLLFVYCFVCMFSLVGCFTVVWWFEFVVGWFAMEGVCVLGFYACVF